MNISAMAHESMRLETAASGKGNERPAPPAKQLLSVGIVGLGRLGSLYAHYFASSVPGARLHAVSDISKPAIDAVKRDVGIGVAYTDYKALCGDSGVDAVIVATPTRLPGEVVKTAAVAKKAIFCEKPLSLNLKEAEGIKVAVAQHGVYFQLGLMRRFDRAYTS